MPNKDNNSSNRERKKNTEKNKKNHIYSSKHIRIKENTININKIKENNNNLT